MKYDRNLKAAVLSDALSAVVKRLLRFFFQNKYKNNHFHRIVKANDGFTGVQCVLIILYQMSFGT